MSHGILNEIYANRLDTACIRNFGLIVTSQIIFPRISEAKVSDYA
jgi:GH15 family glucan-1,4-alpha-glucosidase